MPITLDALRNTSRPRKKRKIVGRGTSSGVGKTCGRGVKGMGARSGYKRRYGAEGGGVPLYRRVPTRGFSNARFTKRFVVINLAQIEALFQTGETVSLETLQEKGFFKGTSCGVKVLGDGAITKKVVLKVEAVSESAKQKLQEAGIKLHHDV